MNELLIDRDSIENFIDGDTEMLADLSVIFVRFLPGLMARMNLATNNGDSGMLREAAHELKGQLGYFFCQSLIEQVGQIEELAKAEQLDQADTRVDEVSHGVDRLLDELRTLTNLELKLERD